MFPSLRFCLSTDIVRITHFCMYVCMYAIFIQILVVGYEKHLCNVTERTMAVQGQYRVNEVVVFDNNQLVSMESACAT